ncbi:hypothetical protein [Streptococcus sp. DD13]|uniref:hypothetical protein n=1 Tax=Streptococcus sp. DD13 TaxID=1777881 RepID=UPI00079B3C02|nr:hypothetical protein [Streptococcus sp. DD13]KXT79001.1 hypothetical protein STRDD13_00257 [Streptococcus sp. DD13]
MRAVTLKTLLEKEELRATDLFSGNPLEQSTLLKSVNHLFKHIPDVPDYSQETRENQ